MARSAYRLVSRLLAMARKVSTGGSYVVTGGEVGIRLVTQQPVVETRQQSGRSYRLSGTAVTAATSESNAINKARGDNGTCAIQTPRVSNSPSALATWPIRSRMKIDTLNS